MLLNWNFDNSYLKLPENFYSFVKADIFPKPKIALFNKELSENLNLQFSNTNDHNLALILSGQKKAEGSILFSQAYAGHQFGHFTILGDGRALFLGEHINNKNERFDIQLKGSGKTPYSRNGDGKAVLGPMLREYIISETMFYLGIPTTRSLAVILTGEKILREKYFPGAILTRVAKSHIRVGTFQFASIHKDKNYIRELTNYSINRHYPELLKNKYNVEDFLEKIVLKQVDLIVNWMRVGFIHGVMNTDNMSIVGETIDYGPCAFMDEYNSKTVFSSIDQFGRYSYENQPKIAQWNLARFAETILFLIDKDEKIAIKKAEKILSKFQDEYNHEWLKMMKEKIGLVENNQNDIKLIAELLNIMHVFKLDYTNTFLDLKDDKLNKHVLFKEWLEKYKDRKKLEKKDKDILKNIKEKTNPVIIPRNHIVEKYIKEAENNKYKNLKNFLNLIKNPYDSNNIPDNLKKPATSEEKVFQTFCGT